MQNNKYKTSRIFLFLIFFLLVACEETKLLDSEVIILNTYKIKDSAYVKYKIKNICENDIKGWNIYFRVNLESNRQVTAFQGLTYTLEPGEMSAILAAFGQIPNHFDPTDRPRTASLKLIELY